MRDPLTDLARVKGVSLERKLPLLMTAVLLTILGGGVLLAYREIRGAAEVVATNRMRDLTEVLANSAGGAVPRIGDRLRDVAREGAVHRVLTSRTPQRADIDAVRDVFSDLPTSADSGLVTELWASDGRIVFAQGGERLDVSRPTTSGVVTGPDSLSTGEFYESGGRVYYWFTRPVMQDGRRIGTIAQRRRLNAQPSTAQEIRRLAGDDNVRVLLRNASGSLFTTLGGAPVSEPLDVDSSGELTTYTPSDAPASERVVSFEKAVERTPWLVILELPYTALTAGPTDMLRRFVMMSLLLLLIGATALWLISRRITRPLTRLTAAAEGIAQGDYTQRVNPRGDYEIARLGVSFNRMANEISAANKQLHAAAGAAADAQQAAEKANASKSNFLAAMSHELRTPLNAIAGYVDLMELELRGPLTSEQRADLGRIKRNQQYLLGLIEEILVFTQLDAQRLELDISDTPIDAVIRDAETMVQPQIKAKGINYHFERCEQELIVRADGAKLQQIIINLLVNAAKYTETGGSITVDCGDMDGKIQLRVTDTGMGIPPDKLSNIFDPFVQLDRSLNQPREGVGLGLTISRDLARAMGGDLTVDSEPGRGSTFTLELPAAHGVAAGSDEAIRRSEVAATASR
ncbi:MAG: sensor histidine kinase [Gemmatimonadaceae bacterium]